METKTDSVVEADPQERKPRRFRFSILTILLVTAIVGLSVAYYQSRRELTKAQAEMFLMRHRYEVLDVRDKSKIYVRPIKSPVERMWQWRVYLPSGGTYRLKYDINSIPPKNPKTPTLSNITVPPGWYTITQMFLFDPTDSRRNWKSYLAVGSPQTSMAARGSFAREEVPWLEATPTRGYFVLPEHADGTKGRTVEFKVTPDMDVNLFSLGHPPSFYSQTEHAADEEVQLMRWEVADPSKRFQDDSDDYLPLEVFRLWIEKEPPPKRRP